MICKLVVITSNWNYDLSHKVGLS